MPSTDDTHEYVFKSGEYGPMYQFWYRDRSGNYYRYTNAPADHPDFDPYFGQPLMDPEQPLPEKNPEFFTPEGYKLSMAAPQGQEPQQNPAYNQADPRNIWWAVAAQGGKPSYFYLDADVKENLDLYVQHQLRVADAGLGRYRGYATQLFAGKHPKDRITGAFLMLVDQGYYDVEELCNATVGDVEFVDQAVLILGKKFIADLSFYDFITSLVAMRSPAEPLFVYDTKHGKTPVGINYIYSVFASLRVSPKFLLYWNASHLYSRIMNRMAFQQVPAEEIEVAAMDELARTLTTRDDVRHLVDYKIQVALVRNYEQNAMTKSLQHLSSDDFGIAIIRSDLTGLRQDEKEFSEWLHAEPMHDTSPAEEQAIAEELQADMAQQDQPEAQPQQAAPGEQPPKPPGQEGDEKPVPAEAEGP